MDPYLFPDSFIAHEGRDEEHTSVPGGPGSGRYRKGSGKKPFQHGSGTFYEHVRQYRKDGYSDNEIAKAMNMTLNEFRRQYSISRSEIKTQELSQVKEMAAKGMTATEIGRELGKNESVIRSMLKPEYEARLTRTQNTAEILRELVENKKYLDVGKGAEIELGVTNDKLDTAIQMLTNDGYKLQYLKVPQVTDPSKFTWVEVLTKDDVPWKELNDHQMDIQGVGDYTSDDGGLTFRALEFPESISSDRIMIRYNEEGGLAKDGVMELRRGVPDLDLGNSHYAQVRIAVDGDHYLKGMAVYGDDLPDGYDIVFNTNKHVGTDKMDVLKKMKIDPSTGEIDQFNPFGATILANGQSYYTGEDGKQHLSAINKVNEEGKWGDWSKTLSSQFLSKQSLPLIKRQLEVSYSEKADDLDEIMKLTNPEVKQYLLEKFASDADASAVHLKAVGFDRQASHVIIPIESLKDDEIYAPNYKDGEKVALIRYPHAGTFEIPTLTVNNKNKEGQSVLGTHPEDAVGINHNVADRLSGADFDGDTVTVIPMNNKVKITSTKPLEQLRDFDPKEVYAAYDGMPKTSAENGFRKQLEMGKVSNLITDMTLKGAPTDDIAKAVKHSMVVIDAEKHNLDWRRSEQENDIQLLKEKWQDGGGASTVISRSKGQERISKENEAASRGITTRNTNPETGERIRIWEPDIYVDKNGKTKERKVVSTKMAETNDAYTLLSKNPNPKEIAYADYANSLKALANTARKEYLVTPSTKYSASAAKVYANEVASLNQKLNDALKNAPRERLAQIRANQVYQSKLAANPNMEKDEKKKLKNQALVAARSSVGSVSRRNRYISLTDKEWEAIQAGAVSHSKIVDILNNSDIDSLRSKAMPRATTTLSSTKIARIKAYAEAGRTQAQIAEALGISTSTVSNVLRNNS